MTIFVLWIHGRGRFRETPGDVLVADALRRDDESDEYWTIVHELQRRGDRQTFELALKLATSANDAEKELGLNVLAQIGYSEGRPFSKSLCPSFSWRRSTPSPLSR